MTDPHNHFRLTACPHVFSSERGRLDVMRPAGGNVNDTPQLRVTAAGAPLSKSEKLILFVVACYPADDGSSGEFVVSLARLAAESLHTQAEVMGLLRRLEQQGMLQVIPDPVALRIRFANARRSHAGAVSRKDRQEIARPGAIVAEMAFSKRAGGWG